MPADPTTLSPAAERILRTAAELIAVRGYAATSTRDIATAVGVSQPALYKHFAAKTDILAALVRLGLEQPLATADQLAALDAPAVVKLHRWLSDSLNHFRDSRYVLMSILTTPDLQDDRFATELALLDRFDRVVIDLVTAGKREGDVRDLDPVSGARMVQALFDALALPAIAVEPAEITEFALTGLLRDSTRLPGIRTAAAALDLPEA
ncbi:TetR/AcrR family transcriptional regulator [Nocardia sp. 2]|uniref:TetR/AcrR family transcriptional regulator n=1 Tax=Nocardia acididurans TaxID=2802282 RepID=A0ABS1MEY1_9NOCA|nr:TetR/AcrR family transcriptional regulator [Nocardia acididurans]MBL1079117.1 TetR/AcrR family transcriptional regulator [Nocardia acididurans]